MLLYYIIHIISYYIYTHEQIHIPTHVHIYTYLHIHIYISNFFCRNSYFFSIEISHGTTV